MRKLIESLRNAQIELEHYASDLELVMEKAREIAALLSKYSAETETLEDLLRLFSDRENEIFGLLGQGLTGPEIAGKLGISVATFNKHRDNMKIKLKMPSSKALVKLAISRHK